MKKIHLLIIDPQNDFCRYDRPDKPPTGEETGLDYFNGSLFVNGADQDMDRLAAMINRIHKKITGLHVTLDSHRLIDVAHPIFWINDKNESPPPFTIIEKEDVIDGVWRPRNIAWQKRMVDYVTALEDNKRNKLCIWPPHCMIGTEGHAIYKSVSEAILIWSGGFRIPNFCTKGSNIFTEHYSAVKADVPDPADASTQINTPFLDLLKVADEILLSGEALSHCLASTAGDIFDDFGEDAIKKFVLLTDACSNVGGFEPLGEGFINEYTAKGMRTSTTVEYLA